MTVFLVWALSHSNEFVFHLLQQLIDALVREDIRNIILLLAHACPDDINAPYNKDDGRTALHIAAALGNVVFVQLLLWVCKYWILCVS